MSKICERNHPVVKNIRKAMEERDICVDELSEKSGIICNDLKKILADNKPLLTKEEYIAKCDSYFSK